MSRAWRWFVLSTCLLFLASLLLPWMEQGRQSARRMQSANNLKQLALAFANYEASFRRFPIGADEDENGAKHGWYTRLMPYTEASSLYDRVDFNLPWDHPFNSFLFKREYGFAINPQIDWKATSDSFGLLHYFGNPRVVHRNSNVQISDLSAGTNHTWIGSEIGQRFHPWGYPFNWRRLSQIVSDQKSSQTLWYGAIQICYADGSTRLLASNIDPSVASKLDEAAPIVADKSTEVPPRTFEYSQKLNDILRVPINWEGQTSIITKGQWGHELVLNSDGKAETLEFSSYIEQPTNEFAKCLSENRELRFIVLRIPLTDSLALQLEQLTHLQALSVQGSRLSSDVIGELSILSSLRELAGVDPSELEALQQALPGCRVTPKIDRRPNLSHTQPP